MLINLSLSPGTIEYEANLRHENEMKRLQSEMKERAKMERENHDLTLEKIRTKASEDRTTVLESVKYSSYIPSLAYESEYL